MTLRNLGILARIHINADLAAAFDLGGAHEQLVAAANKLARIFREKTRDL